MAFLEFQLQRSAQPLTDAWRQAPICPRGPTHLGLSFRPLQAAAFGLEPLPTLKALLAYPFDWVRLGAYWSRIEPSPGAFDTRELDDQIAAAEAAGKGIILCVGPMKTFGYPEFFVPAHHLERPFPEGALIRPAAYPALLEAAGAHLTRLVERYRSHTAILAWQLEHEAVDPLGIEHSWRLTADLAAQELRVLRSADPSRPVLMNGYLPTSWPVRLSQGWRTRDQGDSLAVARRLADWVGVDDYPRNALAALGKFSVYLDGSRSRWLREKRQRLLDWALAQHKPLLVAEGQAEPWEAVTTPPSPAGQVMASCPPEGLIANYNAWMELSSSETRLEAYLFWGAEYWVLRQQMGDPSYLKAFERILTGS